MAWYFWRIVIFGFFLLLKKPKKSWIHFPITISNGDFEGNETLCQSGLSNDLNWAINSLITSFFRVVEDVFDCFLSALSLTSDSEDDPEPSELDSLEDCVPKFKKKIVKSKILGHNNVSYILYFFTCLIFVFFLLLEINFFFLFFTFSGGIFSLFRYFYGFWNMK